MMDVEVSRPALVIDAREITASTELPPDGLNTISTVGLGVGEPKGGDAEGSYDELVVGSNVELVVGSKVELAIVGVG